ncbi:MAG: hypothetical protein J6V13_02500 [Paludibacteraceae bacterium]|nr:hypothetical protein [Paludibacteraceae bacterium]
MKKITILFAALAALLSCNKENPVTPEIPSQETYSVTLTAVAPTAGDDTKTTLVEGGKFVHWSKGDAIKVMFAAQVMKDELMNGSDQFESEGQVLTSYFEEETANEANFKIDAFTLNAANKKYYIQTGIALYPSSAYAKSSKRAYNNPTTTVYYSLPTEQVAVKDNIESNLNFAYADVDIYEFTSGSVPELQFKNACSLIKLTMPQSFNDKNVVSVTIESNDASYLSGKGTVDFAKFPGEFKVDVAGDSKNPGVTLVNETGFEAGASYYAVVWPGEHSGLTFTFTAEDGAKATVTASKAVNLQASHVKPYTFKSALQFEEGESWVYYAPGEGTGKYYYDNGTVGDNPAPMDRTILGVVFYNGNPRDGKDTALPAHCTHGLAISLNFTSQVRFHAKTQVGSWPSNTALHGLGTLYGYSAMTAWKDAGEYASITLYNTNYGDIDASKTSGWYHATDKEWDIMASNIGALNASLEECGAAKIPESGVNCWVPILGSTLKRGMYVYSCKSTGVSYDSYLVSNKLNARPIFAF